MQRNARAGITPEQLFGRIAQIAFEPEEGFVRLVELAGLDPAVDFRNAVLRGDMSHQDLKGFDFTGATFASTVDLTGADLSGATGITAEMLNTAKWDATTILPGVQFWTACKPPPWADDYGRDRYGPWVTFRVPGTDITQRMRWCPSGEFMMGSPESEPGRYHDDENPQHHVVLAHGFWMFDTTVTEALWTAVTSQPTSSRRLGRFPITHVSWNDAREFIQRLNGLLPGLSLSLPSEACWEYACRAGTRTAYASGMEITKKQVCFDSRTSVQAGSLPPNPWGLHEMHGNVWEWCDDDWHETYDDAPNDGSVWFDLDGPARRVVRGGAHDCDAPNVRAAIRDADDPTARYGNVGFRCVRVHSESDGDAALAAVLQSPACEDNVERASPQEPGAPPSAPRPQLPKPKWATEAGRDRFGRYAIIEIPGTGATQRLRWIPPGKFEIGSPASEAKRFNDEGPQLEIAFAQGYWMFDTPCTQEFWQAVTGDNPSYFKSPTRPVETVSFEDVTAFLDSLNENISGLYLSLPSEAQWEYACRAGTLAATYAGNPEILGRNNAPALDRIAWYAGNSGVGFELENGHDSSSWPEKQFEHIRAGTHPVALKDPNDWGLYDMLGNVWEWCGDHWHDFYLGIPRDGSVWTDPNSSGARVIRGASWAEEATGVRAACRATHAPSLREDIVGFRCVRLPDDSVAKRRSTSESRATRARTRRQPSQSGS